MRKQTPAPKVSHPVVPPLAPAKEPPPPAPAAKEPPVEAPPPKELPAMTFFLSDIEKEAAEEWKAMSKPARAIVGELLYWGEKTADFELVRKELATISDEDWAAALAELRKGIVVEDVKGTPFSPRHRLRINPAVAAAIK